MNTKLVLNLVCLLSFSTLSLAIENPNVGSPFENRSNPSRSGQPQRSISGPNAYGRSGNDIVSGNVGGMKHFRGAVPYGSSYYTGAYSRNSGSWSVSNFLRRSANPIVNDRNPGRPGSYYEPKRTVSSYRRPDGTSGLSRPKMTGQAQSSPYAKPPMDPILDTKYQQRPLSSNNMELELILTRREELRQKEKENKETLNEEKIEKKSFFELTRISEEGEKQNEKNAVDQVKPPLTPEQEVLAEFQEEHAKALYEQKSIRVQKEEGDESLQHDKQKRKDFSSPQMDFSQEWNPEMVGAVDGKKVLGEHETFAALAEEKFANHMRSAEDFIEQGHFYKAADTFSLAVVWKPNDARGHLGQSFSLFAAGEYMSSAYYLSRAFELDPQFAFRKYNLSEFIGDRDTFENRVVELITWQERSGSGELALLLAYVSYQDGKSERAKTSINAAKDVMPDNKAVTVLKNIIDSVETLE